MKKSEYIEQFLNFLADAEKTYNLALKEKEEQEKLESDYIHTLELENLNYRERSKLATQLRNCLRERRKSKDIVELLEPIVLFKKDDANKKTLGKMTRLLGEIRKIERYHENRHYNKKIQK